MGRGARPCSRAAPRPSSSAPPGPSRRARTWWTANTSSSWSTRPTRSRARSARRCVAPVITYVPEGSWENPAGHMSKPGTITLPGGSVRRAARQRGQEPEGRRLQDDPASRRVGRQPERDADRRRQAERAVEGQRRARLLGRRLLHEVARRSEQVRHREARRPGGQDRRPREHPRHVRDDVRQPEARAAERSSRPAAATRTAASAAIRRSRRRSSARCSCRSRSTTRWRRSRG